MKGPSQEDKSPINDFNGNYQFLNNDYPSWVNLDTVLYPSISIAYQASRTDSENIRKQLYEVQSYQQFKNICMKIQNPLNWAFMKYKVMQRLIRDKFKRNKDLGSKLIATHPRNLINTFKEGGQNQQYWGIVNGKGQNTLGKILLTIRQEIMSGNDWIHWITDQGIQNDDKMRPIVELIVIRDDKPIDKLYLQKKNKFFFGNQESNDYKLDHPSISKTHACIYYGLDHNLMIVDLGSSNGTTIMRDEKKIKLEACGPIALEKNDLIIFGLSSRKYRVEIDVSKVEIYMKEKKKQSEKQIVQTNTKDLHRVERERERQRDRKKSRSRSRSPKHKKKHRR